MLVILIQNMPVIYQDFSPFVILLMHLNKYKQQN